MHLRGRRFDTGQLIELHVGGGKVDRAVYCSEGAERHLSQPQPWIFPGLVDLQINGCGGREFSGPDLCTEDLVSVAAKMSRFGVSRFCPTLTTQSHEILKRSLTVIARACDASRSLARRVAGIHLEGPYISPEDGPRGAHPRAYCRPPDWNEFQQLQEAAGGRIRLLTMSPEYTGSAELIRRVISSGVVVAIGHTAATGEQIRAAADAGATLSTHLGNGTHLTLPRHPNYIWDQLAEDRLTATLIADGQHLPPEVLRTFIRVKTPERCVLVSDLAGQGGLPPGRYRAALGEVEMLPNGRLVVAGQTQMLAGAAAPLITGLANVVQSVGVRLADAVRMAAHQPARVLNLPVGGFVPGDPADLALVEWDSTRDRGPGLPSVRALIVDGELLHGKL
jgi:N-acetylglucosamine-6-phosphate deacetylase